MASLLGNNYLPTEYQSFIHMSRYSRWLEDEGRRESWSETVSRLVSFFQTFWSTNITNHCISPLSFIKNFSNSLSNIFYLL